MSLIGASLDVAADQVIDATGKLVLAGRDRPAHASRHAVRRHRHDRRRHLRPDGRRVRRHDVPRRLLHPGPGPVVRRGARRLAREARGQGDHRQRVPHRRHRPRRRRLARGARDAPGAGDHLVQALHGLQGRADGRRRDALPDDAGRRRDGRARDGACRERRRDRRARQARRSRPGTPRRATTRSPGRPSSRARRRTARSSWPGSPARRSTSSTSRARTPSTRSRAARDQNWDVWGETCTQYFFTDITDLDEPDFGGAKYVFSPPVRDKSNQPVLWDAVRTDVLSAISTDHCAFLLDGQKTLGKDDFSKIPNGAPGLEDRLRMIHHFGVNEGRITLNRMVDLLSTTPAKLFGLYPRKGTIAPGSRRRHRRLRPEPQDDHLGGDPALEVGLHPLRGHRGDGRRRRDADSRHRRRRGRRAAGRAGLRPVRASARSSASSSSEPKRGEPGPRADCHEVPLAPRICARPAGRAIAVSRR